MVDISIRGSIGKEEIMKTLTTQTVREYNSQNIGVNMKFLTANGDLCKRGFVVSFDGDNKFFKTKSEAEKVTEKDFIIEESPIWYNDACGLYKR